MTIEWLYIAFLGIVLLSVAVVFLGLELRKLKRINARLVEQVDSINQDLATMCLSAVNVDSYLAEHRAQLAEFSETLTQTQEVEIKTSSPYQLIIQKVRMGISEQQLVKEFGLSRDEAALLIKLHG